ncbi:MAG: hypothetical protein AAF634_18095, partial [Bacteroidota bacterium]
EDEGLLLAHRAFWQYPYATRTQATISEMVYVPDMIKDGLYLLQMQMMLRQKRSYFIKTIPALYYPVLLFPALRKLCGSLA